MQFAVLRVHLACSAMGFQARAGAAAMFAKSETAMPSRKAGRTVQR